MYTDLVNNSLACEFLEIRKSLASNLLMCDLNLKNQLVKETLLREDDLTLNKAIAIYREAEIFNYKLKKWIKTIMRSV